jgi:hypothetical protein
MPIEYKKNLALLREDVLVDEAETLLEWLQKKKSARVDLSACSYLHSSILQVLMAASPVVASWPADPDLCRWLQSALSGESSR